MSNSYQLEPEGGLSLDLLIRQIDNRLTALRPLVREFEQLEAARAALVADYGAAGTGRARRSARSAEIAQVTGSGKPTVHSTVYALTRKRVLERAGDGVQLSSSSLEEVASPGRRATPARRPAARKPARRAARANAARRASAGRADAQSTPAPATPTAAVPSTQLRPPQEATPNRP